MKRSPRRKRKSGHSLSEVNIAVGWKVLRKHAGFWLLVSGFLFVGVINSAVSVNMVSNMTSVNSNGAEVVTGGHSVVWAGYVMSLYMGVVLVAKVALGWIFDRFGITGGVLVLLPAGMYFPVLPNNLLGPDPRSRMLRCRYLHGNHRTVHHDFA